VKALVVGASGLVGGALLRELGSAAVGTYRTRAGPGLRHLDARDASSLRDLVRETTPEVIYFPAAEPSVDWCEANPDAARAANVAPVLNGLEAAREFGANLVFYSTDYVFDGEHGPYAEDDQAAPLSVYGRHKREVEERVLDAGGTVIRTTTVYGEERPPAKNFVMRLVAALQGGRRVTVPSDQWSTPTWSDELARASVRVAPRRGIWHVAGCDFLPRDGFARLVADVFDLDPNLIHSVATADLHQIARRPFRGGLRTAKLTDELHIEVVPTRVALANLSVGLGVALPAL
jgi:dTDP-4-dehydrorhamnose reductase